MSSINIEVLSTQVQQKKNSKGGTYEEMTVAHRLDDGQIVGFKLFDFACPPGVWNTLKGAPTGSFFSVDREKDKSGKYWQWVGIHRQDAPSAASMASQTSNVGMIQGGVRPVPTKPTYETPEERAQKQVYIIRQSSIASAVDLLKDHGKQPNVDEVIKVARAFEAYVFGNTIEDLVSDEIV